MAEVSIIYLPSGEGGRKVGVDDFLASGHGIDDLLALATAELREPPRDDEEEAPTIPYRTTPNGLIWDRPTQNGAVPTPLTNFSARIVADVARDDGAEVQRSFEIEARLGDRQKRFGVPAAKFNSMGWATEHLGASAVVYPGMTLKDHARAAVQMLSEGIEGRRIFAHTGWRQVDGVWLYLHGGGAIGSIEATEGFEVELDEALSLYGLPEPPEGEDLIRAIRASLGVWEVAPDGLIVPQHAATYRAAMGESDFSVHVVGETGEGKSELAALFQQHFGAGLDSRRLTSWESTENALESKAHALKDSLMVVDDFAPGGTPYDVQKFHRKADRIMRGKGNASGRERLRGDLTARPPRPPRALILSTGEDTPRGQSLRARALILEHEKGVLDWPDLTYRQKEAREGLYARAMASFVSWLAKDYDEIRERLPEERQRLREEASRGGEHKRTPGIVADLWLGLEYFLAFAWEADAISEEEAEELRQRGRKAITEATASQAAHQAASDPTVRFRELLSAAIASGRAHVADVDGGEPEDSTEALGWRKRTVGTGEYEREEWQPRGDKVGWVKGEDLYLEPQASYRAAQAQAQGGESISVGTQTLRKRLKEKGLLLSTDEKRQTITVRRTIEGVQRNVLHLGKDFLFSDNPEPDKPDTEEGNPHKNGDCGPDSMSGSAEGSGKPDIETDEMSGFGGNRRVSDPEADTEDGLSNAANGGDCRVCRVLEEDEGLPNNGDARADRQDRFIGLGEYELVDTAESIDALVRRLEKAEVVALDLETTGLDPRRDRIRLLSLATEREAWLVDNFSVDVRDLLEALNEKTLLVHNAMHDLLFLRNLGYVHRGRVADTMILSRMAYAGQRDENGKRLEHSLEACCERDLGVTLDKTHQKADWSEDTSEEMRAYAAADARVVLPLHGALEKKLWDAGQEWAVEIEERALLAGIEMAHNGVGVDMERWLGIVEEAGAKLDELRDALDGLVGDPPEEVKRRNAKNKNVPAERKDGWNWDSPDQIKAAAASVGLKLKKTSMDYLKLVDHGFAGALLAYKEVKSGLSTYGEKFFEPTEEGREVYADGRLYPSWGMCRADTGRMSCSSPNMQNVPKKGKLGALRGCVVAPEGRRLIKADYSQIELRIVAKIAGEGAMLEAYREGEDLHLATARSITGREEVGEDDRQLAKAVNFGLLYGQGAKGLRAYARDKYGVEMSIEEARRYRERWFGTYPGIRAWHRREGTDFDAGEDSASTMTGRMRRVGSFTEKVNHPVQGTGADGLKMGMALFQERLPEHLDAKLVIACHDELVVECPEDRAEEVARFVEEVMVDGMDEVVNPGLGADHPDRVPIEVDIEILGTWGGD